jgi:hypothetical protein
LVEEETAMFKLEIGQELEFIEPATVDGRTIPPGTRVRVGYIQTELMEPRVTVVVLGKDAPETLTVDRHVLTIHCRVVTRAA